MLSFSHERKSPVSEKEKTFENERATHAFRSDTRRLGHRQKDPAYLSQIRCVGFRFGRSDGDGGQTLYNVTKAIGRVLCQHLPQDYSDALAILMTYVEIEVPSKPNDTRPPKPSFNKIPAATESIIGRRDPKWTTNGIFFDLYGTLLVYGNMDSV